jgi:hypothetical protein
MVQISKLTKAELAITGFKNRSIASRFMKQILNKKARDFKDKVELINALTTKYFEMKNYGIDLNDIAKVERNVKQVDKFVKKSQEEYNKLLEREDLQQIVSDLEVENRPDTTWKFYKFMHYEISIFRLESTIGYAVSLPLHFYEDSNKKNVVKFENLKDNLCFWRCLAAHMNPDKKAYRRLETPTKELYSNFYGKKYDEAMRV